MQVRGLLKEYASFLDVALRGLDLAVVALAAPVAYHIEYGQWSLPEEYLVTVVLGVLLTAITFAGLKLYRPWRGSGIGAELRLMGLAWVVVIGGISVLTVFLGSVMAGDQGWLLWWAGLGVAALGSMRVILRLVLRRMRALGFNHRRMVIVGEGSLAEYVARQLLNAPWTGLEVLGFFAGDPQEACGMPEGMTCLGGLQDVGDYVANGEVDQVWIAMPLSAEAKVKAVLESLRHSTVDIRFVPDIFGFRLLNHSITDIVGLPVVNVTDSPIYGFNRLFKAIEDGALALVILVLLSPLIALIALGVRLSSPGPVIFKQVRLGSDGRPIKVYKFRTMYVHQEPEGCLSQARREDERVTPLGKVLRRTSLDELPQFYNVLQGRISVVGPRPHALEHNETFKDMVDQYMLRHKVKPGITGWAQVNGYRGEVDNLEQIQKRVEYDLFYIEHWSIWFDLKIIAMSLRKGFIHRNAY